MLTDEQSTRLDELILASSWGTKVKLREADPFRIGDVVLTITDSHFASALLVVAKPLPWGPIEFSLFRVEMLDFSFPKQLVVGPWIGFESFVHSFAAYLASQEPGT